MPRGKQTIDFDSPHDVRVSDGETAVTATWQPYRPGSWYLGEEGDTPEYRLPEGYKIVKVEDGN